MFKTFIITSTVGNFQSFSISNPTVVRKHVHYSPCLLSWHQLLLRWALPPAPHHQSVRRGEAMDFDAREKRKHMHIKAPIITRGVTTVDNQKKTFHGIRMCNQLLKCLSSQFFCLWQSKKKMDLYDEFNSKVTKSFLMTHMTLYTQSENWGMAISIPLSSLFHSIDVLGNKCWYQRFWNEVQSQIQSLGLAEELAQCFPTQVRYPASLRFEYSICVTYHLAGVYSAFHPFEVTNMSTVPAYMDQ